MRLERLAILVVLSGCGSSIPSMQCTPNCAGRSCGSDGCGATCGTCDQGFACTLAGTCEAGCTPSCAGKECGSDGCGGSCGSCSTGFKCSSTGSCDLDPSHLWTLTVTNGTVQQDDPTGATWDAAGGLPDPFVCLTINGVRTCTTTQQDTLMPVWNQALPRATASALQLGVLVEFWDEDLTTNDAICASGMVSVTDQNFVGGIWGAMCTSGGFSATLTP